MKIRYKFVRNGKRYTGRWYQDDGRALAAVERHIGGYYIPALGSVAGDVFEGGVCTVAPRAGGLLVREVKP